MIRSLWREPPLLVDKAVPNIDIDNSCLLSLAAVEFVEIRRIGTSVCVTLGGPTNPHNQNARALQCRDGGVDAFDVSVLPLFRLEFPWSVGCLAGLLWSHVGVAGGLGRGERLLLRVGRRGRNRNRWSCGRARLCRLRVRLGRAGGDGRGGPLSDSMACVLFAAHVY